jgi:hypothetical protein
VHQSVFTNVEVTASRTALPFIRQAATEVLLEQAVPLEREKLLFATLSQLFIDIARFGIERLELSGVVVNDAQRRGQSKLLGPAGDDQRIAGLRQRAADDGIYVDVKFCKLGQPLQLPVEHLQALHRNIVGHDVVHTDLEMV